MNGEVAYKEIVRCINNACVVDAGGLTELNVAGLIKLMCVRSVCVSLGGETGGKETTGET